MASTKACLRRSQRPEARPTNRRGSFRNTGPAQRPRVRPDASANAKRCCDSARERLPAPGRQHCGLARDRRGTSCRYEADAQTGSGRRDTPHRDRPRRDHRPPATPLAGGRHRRRPPARREPTPLTNSPSPSGRRAASKGPRVRSATSVVAAGLVGRRRVDTPRRQRRCKPSSAHGRGDTSSASRHSASPGVIPEHWPSGVSSGQPS